MTLEELIGLLKAAIKPDPDKKYDYIDLDGAKPLPEQLGKLVAYLTVSKLRVINAKMLPPTDSQVTLQGEATFLNQAWPVDLIGSIDRSTTEPRFVLTTTGSAPSGWTFAKSFPNLPEYLGTANLSPVEKPSFFNVLTITNPRLAVATFVDPSADVRLGLSFRGTVAITEDPFGALSKLAAQPVDVAGSITLPAKSGATTTIDLAGPIKGLSFNLGKIDLSEVGLRLQVIEGTGEDDPARSLASIYGIVRISQEISITISSPLMQGDWTWVFTVSLPNEDRYSLASGLKELAALVDGSASDFKYPESYDPLGAFRLSKVTVGIRPDTKTVTFISATVTNPARWSLPIPQTTITDVSLGWTFYRLSDAVEIEGFLGGTIEIGAQPPVHLDVRASLPDFYISAQLRPGDKIDVGQAIRYFLGQSIDLKLQITTLEFGASPQNRTFRLFTVVDTDWTLTVPLLGTPITLTRVNFLVDYAPNKLAGYIQANFALSKRPFYLRAETAGAQDGWVFSGGLVAGEIFTLKDFLQAVIPASFGLTIPNELDAVALTSLGATLYQKTGDFSFNAALVWRLVQLPGTPTIDASFSIASKTVEGSKEKQYSGEVAGGLTVRSFKVGVVYTFAGSNKTIAFKIAFQAAVLTCIFSKKKNKQEQEETILSVKLTGVSFGDLVEYLVNLVDPSLGFRLPAPWDVLYQLKFDNLSLEVNLTTKAVTATYNLDVNLGIIDLKSVSLSYFSRAGTSTVDIAVTGDFLGTTYDKDNPLTWDLLNDPPPSPPGKAEQLLDLRYLGFGQNVTFRQTESFKKVQDVIVALEKDFLPVDDDTNPLVTLPNVKFSGDGNWLIGADFTLLSAVSITGVFNDPNLYGLRVALAGEKVKKLAGLEFEILYKKITDTIGVYHFELTLPDAMRQMQFGAVSVTLPIVAIDIYTNGNFRLDFGFPVNRDFTRSFCVQGGPFIGYGGFYFALLNGATSEKVPAIRNGNFSPVIEFGIGLSMGVGRTLDKGVLTAGLTLTVEAILEGVFGWFNPDDRSAPTDLYYDVRGTASIVGKLYGKVDFVIVKASINIVAYATVTLAMAAYRPIDVTLTMGVQVSASLEIIFFTVTFSFEMKLDLSFRIGEGGNAPWLSASSDSKAHPFQLRQQRTHYRIPPPKPVEIYRWMRDRNKEVPLFDWAPRRVFAAGPVDISLFLVPAFTPALPSKVTAALAGESPAAAADPRVQVVMSLFAPTSTPAGALHAHEVRRISDAAPADAPFNRLASGIFRWAVSSLQKQPGAHVYRSASNTVTIADLDAIACFLSDRKNRNATFTYDRVSGLIEQNFRLRITNPIGLNTVPKQSAIFPMIPEIEMRPDGRTPVQFWKHACADQSYRDFFETYYDQLQPDPGAPKDRMAKNPCAPGPVGIASTGTLRETPLPKGCSAGFEPLSSIIFTDYFGLLAQQSVQAAVETFNAYPYEPSGSGTETLLSVAKLFGGSKLEYRTRPGDTPGTIAAAFGTHVEELRRMNPWLTVDYRERLPQGSTVVWEAGPTVAKIATANADYPLRTGGTLTIQKVRYQVRGQETLGKIATAFAIADVAALMTGDGAADNPASRGLLRPTAALTVPAFAYTVNNNDIIGAADGKAVFDRIAAKFYVRSRQYHSAVLDYVDWYVSTISQNNPSFSGTINIPIAVIKDGQLVDTGKTAPYAVQPTDTLEAVATMFELLQLSPNDPGFAGFRSKITPAPPAPIQPGTAIHLPEFKFTVVPGDSFASIAVTFWPADIAPFATGLAALARANRDADILEARAVLLLPTLKYRILEGDTLASVAAQFDLTIADLAHSIEADAAIFTPYKAGAPRMSIPDVAARDLDTLIGDLIRFGNFNALSATVSRFLLNGARAPIPTKQKQPADPTLWGLYDVAGQQFPAPTGATYGIRFLKGSTAPWFCFEQPSGCTGGMTVTLLRSFVQQHSPSITLDPMTVIGPTAMRPYDLVPPRYGLERSIHWQTATDPHLPGPTGPTASAGEPSLWLFPQTLLQQIAKGPAGVTASTPPYELVASVPSTDGTSPKPLSRYSWATAIPLRVTRSRNEKGGFVPNAYEVAGADQDGRDLLLKAWKYLEAAPSPNDKIYLLYSPSAANPNSKGLVSDAISQAKTFLLKTNLSTDTHSNISAAANAGNFFAGIQSPGAFLKYIWEASITGTGGFYLHYANDSGNGLPDEIFSNGAAATVWALLLVDHQMNRWQPMRGLYAFNNCAVLAENLDAAAIRIAAELRSPAAEDYQRTASVAPGVIGFGMARKNPHGATAPAALTQRLYSLVGYRVLGNQDFAQSHESLPVGPLDKDPEWLNLPPAPPSEHKYWSYQQIVPIAQFGHVNNCPESVVANRNENPYQGITGPTGPAGRPLSRARLDFAYHDVYGNETVSTEPLRPLDVAVGYTDPLIGVGSWPGSAFDYLFQKDAGGVHMETTLSLQVGRCLPGAGVGYEKAISTADADAVRYKQIFYQMQQRDVAFALESNIGAPKSDINDLKAAMTAFITKAKLAADAAATLKLQTYSTTPADTLGSLARTLSVTPGMLAAANPDVEAAKLFPALYVKPKIVPAPAMNTLDSLTKLVTGRVGFGTGQPACAGVVNPDPLCDQQRTGLRIAHPGEHAVSARADLPRASGAAPADVAGDNPTAPLTPGITLRTALRTSIPDFSKVSNTLEDFAAWLQCNVYIEVTDPAQPNGPLLPAGMLAANWDLADLVANGVVIAIDGYAPYHTNNDTFQSIFKALNSQAERPALTEGSFAAGIRSVQGIFQKGKAVRYADFIVPKPLPGAQAGPPMPTFSLRNMAPEAGGIPELATLNRLVPNFFFSGSALLLGYTCCKVGQQDTLATLAEDARITLDQLAFYNQQTKLGGSVTLSIPDLVYFSDPAKSWSAYSPVSTDSLDGVAKTFATTALALANANRSLPGIFRPDAAVIIDGKTVPAKALDSMESMHANFPSLTFEAFVEKLKPQSGLYRTNGAAAVPLPAVPGQGDQTQPFESTAKFFNVDTVALLEANRSLYRFLRESSTINSPSASLPVGGYDTVDTVIRRFREEKNVTVSVADLAKANQGRSGLLTAGTRIFLPPNTTRMSAIFTPQIPPAGTKAEASMIFPVDVSVTITRQFSLVHPDFVHTESVFRTSSRLVPRLVPSIDGGNTTGLALTGFAEQFEAAFADSRLKCAVSSGAPAAQAGQTPDRSGQLWAVNFGPQGVSRFSVEAYSPKFYALRPLSTELQGPTGAVSFPQYVSGKGLTGTASKRFDSVDLDSWMRQFLETVDLFLTPPYAVPAFQSGATRAAVRSPFQPTVEGPVGVASAARIESRGASPALRPAATPHGPEDYERIVEAKQTIANKLREHVVPIVNAPGATGAYEWAAAREALYQQMLVRLADGYKIDAVVQFPVDVQSPVLTPPPGAIGIHPPRVSGKVVPVLYSIPRTSTRSPQSPSNSIAGVAGAYLVSAPYLAQVIGNVQGVLQKGAVLHPAGAGDPAKAGAYDSLNTVAARLNVNTDPSKAGYWEQWVPFIQRNAEAAVFIDSASFPLSRIERAADASDTLTSLSDFFGRDLASVARANQELQGIFIPGELRAGVYSTPYNVKKDDTLVQIADGLSVANPTQPRLTIDGLAFAVRNLKGIFTPSVKLRIVEALPEITLSTAKVSLGRIDMPGNPNPALTCLLTVKQTAERSKLLLNLDYAINEIEYSIQNVAGAGNYQASSWLTLLIPFVSGKTRDIGVHTVIEQVQIPIPLRSYPPPSLLTGQSGLPSDPGAVELVKAREWDYRFDAQTRKAAQDTDHIRVAFGEHPNTFSGALALDQLFKSLAAFMEAYPALTNDLSRLTTQKVGADDPVAAYAVQAFSQLSQSIATALPAGKLAESAGSDPANIYGYRMTNSSDGTYLKTLALEIERGPVGASAVWPAILIKSTTAPTDGTGPDRGFLPMAGGAGFYEYPADFKQDQSQTYRFLFKERDIIRNSTGRGAISVSRNDRLITHGPLGPTGPTGPVQTASDFLYQTPFVEFVDPLVALVDQDAPIDISGLLPGTNPKALCRHILNLLTGVIDVVPDGLQPGQYMEILCTYGFPLTGASSDRLIAKTPIRLVPANFVEPANVKEFAYQLASSLHRWHLESGVPSKDGLILFEVTVFTESRSTLRTASSPPLGARGVTALPLKPVFRLSQLELPMSAVNWGLTGPASCDPV